MDNFDESHGLSKLKHPFESRKDHMTADWSKQRVVIGASTERNLLELNEYRILVRELGLHELFKTALQASGSEPDAKKAAEYLLHELGFKWQVNGTPPTNPADATPGQKRAGKPNL